MNERVEKTSESINPVFSISKDGTILYSNEASEPILHEWGVRVGDKIPLSIVDLVQRVLSRNNPEKIEVKVGNKLYLVVFSPLPEQESVSVSGFDISNQKEEENTSSKNERYVKVIGIDATDHVCIEEALLNARDELDLHFQERTAELQRFHKELIDEIEERRWAENERKQLLIKVEEQRTQLQTILNSLPVGVWVSDPMGKMLMVNEAASTIYGGKAPAVDNLEGYSVYRIWWPDTGNEIPVEDYPLPRALKGEKVKDMVMDHERFDGTRGAHIASSTPLRDSRGNITGAVVVAMDITELKRAQEEKSQLIRDIDEKRAQLQAIIDSMPVGLWVVDATRKMTFINDIARKIWGGNAPCAKNINEYNEYKAWWSETGERINVEDMPLARAIRGETLTEVAVNFERFDGTHGTQLVSSAPIRTSDGTISGGIAIVQDITELRQAEEALAKIKVIRKKEIHHRIKNNLQVISSLLDLQAEKFRGKKNIEDSQILEAFKESQGRVISMALIHEELHKGGENDTLNFSAYIKELADNLFLSYRLGNKGTSLEMDIEEEIYFDMDIAVPLGIIINELVSNSLKHAFPYSDKGEIQIKLHREENGECEIEDSKSTTFTLSVADNGVGISEDFDIEEFNSLGLQLVTTLVDQL